MQRSVTLASVCAVAFAAAAVAPVTLAVRPAAAVAAPRSGLAPGDEYFGRMKLSYLGIMNTLKDEAIRAGQRTTNRGLISRVSFAEDALNAWASRYPNDPQLARTYYLAVTVFKKIATHEGQQKALRYTNLLAKQYASTSFGRQARKDLAVRLSAHTQVAHTGQTGAGRNVTTSARRVSTSHHKQ